MDYRYIPFIIILCHAGLPVKAQTECEESLLLSKYTGADNLSVGVMGQRMEYFIIQDPTRR